jgi:hypothetical protein
MNPHQQNKVDISVSPCLPFNLSILPLTILPQSMSPEEQRLLRLYGKMPTKKDLLQNKLKVRSSRALSNRTQPPSPQPPSNPHPHLNDTSPTNHPN